jgi:dGTP triphosphohydrolase
MEEPDDLPRNYREKSAEEPLPRVICDYIAGMTDPFIYQQYEKYCRE